MALYRVLEKTGSVEGLDAPARSLLAEARSRSVQGVDRILALARQGGGFTWFSGYDATSVPLTIIMPGISLLTLVLLFGSYDPARRPI